MSRSTSRPRRRLALAIAGLLTAAAPLVAADTASATGPRGYHWWYTDSWGYTYLLWCTTSGDP